MTQAPAIEGKSQSVTPGSRPLLPPFTRELAVQKVRLAEDVGPRPEDDPGLSELGI
jgi:nuclear transport factor 2 (NTF2) superfamily protein